MLNQFDFFYVEVSSSRKTDLLKAGVKREDIRSTQQWVSFGRNKYPRVTYSATVGYVDAPVENASKKADALAAQWRGKGVSVSVKYHCSD